ncbi:MAG: serine/threonine-protein kinase [Aureliella sp.]
MSASDPSLSLKEALAREALEECLDRFDEAWHAGGPPSLVEAVAAGGAAPDLVVELIKIDLEHRWRRARSQMSIHGEADAEQGGPRWHAVLEDYVELLPQSLSGELPLELIAEEYRVRHLWGDRPSIDAFRSRFRQHDPAALEGHLRAIDRELLRSRSYRLERSLCSGHAGGGGFAAALAVLEVGDEIDDFRLLNELGCGAFARVFLAQQKSMQRLVALKASTRRTFESPVLSKLDHPGIVRVYDERVLGALALMYMQYVPGGTLRSIVDWRQAFADRPPTGQAYLDELERLLREKGETPSQLPQGSGIQSWQWGKTVAWMGARLAEALAHAHRVGVWHRDIKPENILLTSDGRPMLVDFNLSFGETVEGSCVDDAFGGSLAYMSPEQLQVLLGQARADAVGPASDVYSLAVVLWELLTGTRPFELHAQSTTALSPSDLLAARLEPIDSSRLPSDCPRGLRDGLLKSLSIDPGQRPTAAHLARRYQFSTDDALDGLLYPSPGSWSHRWRRHPLRWLIVLGVLPNGLLSLLNIWANDRLTTHNFDKHFFDTVEKPAVNLIAYAVGIVAAIAILGPIARGMNSPHEMSWEERQRMARRCFIAPALASLVILALWCGSGLAFPLWNLVSQHSHVGPVDVIAFVLSQVLHGIIAGTTTFAISTLVTVEAFLPRYLSADEGMLDDAEFDRNDRWLSWASGALSLTPLLAVLALAFSDQFDKSVFVALAMVGFIGHLFTSLLAPRIREGLGALRRMNRPL